MDEVVNGLYNRMRHQDGMSSKGTYNDNFDCDERDNDELHASTGYLVSSSGEDTAWENPLTLRRSCRRTDCTSAA